MAITLFLLALFLPALAVIVGVALVAYAVIQTTCVESPYFLLPIKSIYSTNIET